MIKSTFLRLVRRFADEPQVLGAEVPTFERFPFKAQEVLHLYRDLCRVIYRYPPQERQDLFFKLRNEFRSKRNLAGPRVIRAALRRGHGILEVQKSLLDSRHVRQSGLVSKGSAKGGQSPLRRPSGGAQCVDALFDQVQAVAGHVLPGLKNFRHSLPTLGTRYAEQASQSVASPLRPLRNR